MACASSMKRVFSRVRKSWKINSSQQGIANFDHPRSVFLVGNGILIVGRKKVPRPQKKAPKKEISRKWQTMKKHCNPRLMDSALLRCLLIRIHLWRWLSAEGGGVLTKTTKSYATFSSGGIRTSGCPRFKAMACAHWSFFPSRFGLHDIVCNSSPLQPPTKLMKIWAACGSFLFLCTVTMFLFGS